MGLFSAAASVLNTSATNEQNEINARLTNKANRELAEQQNQWNIEQWNRENAYNDPAEQVKRLRGAGLSAAAAAQSIEGAGNAAPLQSADLSNQQAPAPAIPADFSGLSGMNIIGLAREYEQYRMDKVKADIAQRTKESDIKGILTDNDAKEWSLAQGVRGFLYDLKADPYRLRKIKYDVESSKYQPKLQKIALKIQKVNYKRAEQDYGYLSQMYPEEIRKIGEEIKSIIAHAEKERAEKKVADAQVQNVEQDTALKGEQTKGQSLINFGQVIENAFKKHGAPASEAGRIAALVNDHVLKIDQIDPYLSAIRYYIISGGKKFNASQDLRSVFINDIAPGIGKDYKVPLWSHGTANKISDVLDRAFPFVR